MSAAAARQSLAMVGAQLLSDEGADDRRRLAVLSGEAHAVRFEDLLDTPSWLRCDATTRRQLAERAALAAMAPALARTIDGSWLASLAERLGEGVLDASIEGAATVVDGGIAPSPIEDLAPIGFGMMRLLLSDELAACLPQGTTTASPALAQQCLARAEAMAA